MKVHGSRLIVVAPSPPRTLSGRRGDPLRPPVPPALEYASLGTKAGRLKKELISWFKAGAQITPRDLRKGRQGACDVCPYYDPNGNLGLGQCRAPGCGCTRVKLALLTAECPQGRWPDSKPRQRAGKGPARPPKTG